MLRAFVLFLGVLATTLVGSGQSRQASQPQPAFQVVEATIRELQAALASGRVTSREIVTHYLVRLALYEDRLNAALAVNPRALEEAEARDRERAQGKVRGP